MYWSAGLVALVPPGVVTVTSTVPADPGGDVAVISEASTTDTFVAGLDPTSTDVAPGEVSSADRDACPAGGGPDPGLMLVTVGAAMYVYWSTGSVALVPPGVVTVMSTVPALPAGAVAVMLVVVLTLSRGGCWSRT